MHKGLGHWMGSSCLWILVKPRDAINAIAVADVLVIAPFVADKHDDQGHAYHSCCKPREVDECKKFALLEYPKEECEVVVHNLVLIRRVNTESFLRAKRNGEVVLNHSGSESMVTSQFLFQFSNNEFSSESPFYQSRIVRHRPNVFGIGRWAFKDRAT